MTDETRQPNRVPKGTPTGGQFAATARNESGVALAETGEWLPPGAHRIVACADCASDPARREQPGCGYCDRGRIRTDRYGQVPWHPGKPGTKVGFEDPRDGTWRSATITATARDDLSEFYAVGLLADGQARDIYLPKAIPLHAAQAAARHGINSHEMVAEAACEMHIVNAPTHDETRAFLARIDDGYVEDIARSAREFRTYRAAELRQEGRTGPALDYSADVSTLDTAAIDRAVEAAADFKGQHYAAMTYVTDRDHWHGHTVVQTPSGRIATYKDTAWDRPAEQPVLPWSPPAGTPVAHVALDGTVTRIDQRQETSR
ncbi:hypothetical protein [Nocardioides pakistanensis]